MKLTQETRNGTTLHTLESDGEVLGYVAVDSTIEGRSCGGLRMLPDVDAGEVVGLARAMTLKYGFLGLPQGGSKGGVRGDPEAPPEVRRARLCAFASGFADLLRSGAYTPHSDMGTRGEDIAAMLRSVGLAAPRKSVEDHDSGYYTAASVAAAAGTAARHLGLSAAKSRVAIEGFGKVGRPLARFLEDAGFRVVAVSTRLGAIYHPDGLDVSRLFELSRAMGSAMVDGYPGAHRISTAELLELPVELLCPCARHHSLHAGNAARLQCRIVTAGANNPITEEALRILEQRGVLSLPDFVSNCGGVLGGTMEFAGMRTAKILEMISLGAGSAVTGLLRQAAAEGSSVWEIAERLSRARYAAVKRAAEHPTPVSRLFKAGLRAYRRGLVPRRVAGLLAPAYFRRLPLFRTSGIAPAPCD
jgi:glutamate dehydrogenase/leucine dehydrogenase